MSGLLEPLLRVSLIEECGPVEHQMDRRDRGLTESDVDQKALAVGADVVLSPWFLYRMTWTGMTASRKAPAGCRV
jgi:hypothetical protein